MHHQLEALRPLLGTWEGTGTARFPTIPPNRYREILTFIPDPERPLVYYTQRAQQAPEGTELWTASHWEAGFLRVIAPSVVELTNAQDSGRLEVMRLDLVPEPEGLSLSGTSVGLFNDPRMKATRRIFGVAGDVLIYRVSMSTTAVEPMTPHLEARLRRQTAGVS